MKRYWLKWTGVATLAFALAACGTDDGNNDGASSEQNGETEGPASEETFTIGATQILEHPSLDAAYEGFKQAIADAGLEVEFDFQSAQNDQNNASAIANNFVANQVDLIFANSTPSAQSALQATNDIPILFTSVTNAVEGGLVSAMDEPGENITGVVDLHPDAIENTVHFMDEYFSDAKVGIVYNAGEANSVAQMDEIAVAAEETTLELVSRTVASSSEVQQAVSSLVSEVDILYVFTDNTVVSALETVISEANSAEIPLIVGERIHWHEAVLRHSASTTIRSAIVRERWR